MSGESAEHSTSNTLPYFKPSSCNTFIFNGKIGASSSLFSPKERVGYLEKTRKKQNNLLSLIIIITKYYLRLTLADE